jgi:predicted enzyme related to lactoylglutathione lyase
MLELAEIILEEYDRWAGADSSRFADYFPGLAPVKRSKSMTPAPANPVVHLELRTGNLACACAFYTRLFGWRTEVFQTVSGDYLTLELGARVHGGVVEHDAEHSFWLPYVEVSDVAEATHRARLLGASVLLSPREGPAGWRSILETPAGGEIALWQPKT